MKWTSSKSPFYRLWDLIRHVYGTANKRELCYDNVRVSGNAWDTNLIKVNPVSDNVFLDRKEKKRTSQLVCASVCVQDSAGWHSISANLTDRYPNVQPIPM